jgi:parallel beta-helix repeat protein
VICLTISSLIQAKTITVPLNEPLIQTAIDKSDEGDTVLIQQGIYREHIVLKEQITLKGESAQGTIIQGNGRGVVITAANNTIIKNLTISNGTTGILSSNTHNIIEGCIVKDNKGSGIHTLISVPDIRNCVIVRNKWSGIFCESGRSIKTIIEHNVISENGYSGISLSGMSEILIQNNVLYSNKQFGVWASEDSRKSRIIFNTFFGNRSVANYFVSVDRSNITIDPDYSQTPDGNVIFTTAPKLKGKGKDGATIGLIEDTVLEQKIHDADSDNIPGDKDQCPSMAEDLDGFEDEDGCPEFDNDNDGTYDTQDKCPDNAEDIDNFQDDDGCGDPDNDNDGIPDEKDVCRTNKETINGFKDDDGCPDEVSVNK